jgi:hypothetical protein
MVDGGKPNNLYVLELFLTGGMGCFKIEAGNEF